MVLLLCPIIQRRLKNLQEPSVPLNFTGSCSGDVRLYVTFAFEIALFAGAKLITICLQLSISFKEGVGSPCMALLMCSKAAIESTQ